MDIDSKAIKELAKLIEETGLSEIEVAEGEQVIRVSKNSGVIAGAVEPRQTVMPSDPTLPQAANTDAPDTVAQSHPGAITSPMVGTAYMQAEPGTPPFVKKGDTVQAGDTVMIIEAMKVMNPIKAEKSGTVSQILVEDSQPVEFGDVLMVIE